MKLIPVYKTDLTVPLLKDIANLVMEEFGDNVDLWLKRFNFWWSNPRLSDALPACWVIQNDSMHLVGFFANLPVYYQFGEMKLFAAGSSTYYVKPEARGTLSTALGIMPSRQKGISFAIANTVNETAKELLTKAGYKRIKPINVQEHMINNYMLPICKKSFVSMINWLLQKFFVDNIGYKKYICVIGCKLCNIISGVIPNKKINISDSIYCSNDYNICLCENVSKFMQYLPLHKRGDTIELSKDETTLQWILFSPAVQDLLQRKTLQIFTATGEYCGYLIYDIQHVGKTTVLRIRELQLLKTNDAIIKLILKHTKIEAKNNGCAAVYSALQNPDPEVDKLLGKHILLRLKTDNRYYVKFKKGVFTDIDPYSIYVPSDLDPDVGFI